jgi:3-oxoacyl-[acyl-carrier-protein] synthase II
MTERDSIVITGMGLVSALGNGGDESFASAMAGKCGIRRCDDLLGEEGANVPVRVAGTVVGLNPATVVEEKHVHKYSRSSIYAIVAADEAIEQAQLQDALSPSRIGVVSGSAAPSADLICESMRTVVLSGDPMTVSGSAAPLMSAHAPSALIGLRHGFQGPNFCASAACATGNSLLVLAADQLRNGRADAIVVGATESCVVPLALGAFARARAVNQTSEPIGACRPFDRRRSGLVFGEGAGFLVVERARSAEARGVPAYAEILGEAMTNDAHHLWGPKPESWARTLGEAIARSGLRPSDIDYVSAHAAGTVLGDAAETWALKTALGHHAYDVPISATKGMHGHAFGASSSIELILAVRAMRSRIVLPTVGWAEPDDDCDLDYVGPASRAQTTNVLLKNSFGFGGTNTALVLRVA